MDTSDNLKNDQKKVDLDINKLLNQTLYTIKKGLEEQADIFVSKLCDDSKLSQKSVQKLVSNTSDFLNDIFLKKLKKAIFTALDILNEQTSTIVKIIVNNVTNPFEHLKTEYHRDKHFKNLETYTQPQQYIIGHVFRCQTVKRQVQAKTVPVYGSFVPLRETLKSFLQLPDCFSSIQKYRQNLCIEKDRTSDITQTKV